MTETPNQSDQAERIRRLQERRAASGRSRQAVATSTGRSEAVTPKRTSRRRHPAAATRILLAGLSVSSFFSVAGAIALTHRSATAPTATAPPVSSVSVATNASATAATAGTAVAAGATAQPGAASNVPAHTTTAAS